MSIYGTIMSKIFGASKTPAAPASASGSTSAPASAPPAPAAGAAPAAPAGSVDVAAILDALNEKNPEELDWRKSIVDLMKLVGLDSSLTARKQLAAELNYAGDTSDIGFRVPVMRRRNGVTPAEPAVKIDVGAAF